jgi:hypothetical protein
MSQTGVYAEEGGTGILFLQGDNSVQVGADAGNTIYVQGISPVYTEGDPATFSMRIGLTSNYNWQIINTALPYTMQTHSAYIAKAPAPNIFELPATANVGDTFKVVGYSNFWRINQNASQKIVCGILQTTPGVSGYVQATVATDQIELVCVTANTEFYAIQVLGNPSFN